MRSGHALLKARWLVLALAAALASLPIAAGSSAAQETTTIRLSGWTSSPAEERLLRDELADFDRLHPEIIVSYEPVPTDFQPKLEAMIAAGNEPDVFYVELGQAMRLMRNGALLSLDDFMANAGVDPTEFAGALLSAFTYQGHVYGVPKDFNTLALFFNKDLFDQAGLAYPTSDWTWDQLKSAAAALTSAPGVWGLTTPPDDARFLPFLYQSGGSVLSDDFSQVQFNSPQAVQAMDFYTSFKREGIGAMPADMGAGVGWAGDAFGLGKSAMVMEGGWLIPYLHDKYPDVNYDAVELPAGPAGKSNLFFTVSYSVSARTKAPDAAWTLVNYLTGLDNQQRVLRSGFALPTRLALVSDPFFEDHSASAAIFAGNAYARPFAFGLRTDKVNKAINEALERVLLGRQSSGDAVAQATKEIEDAIRD